MSNFNSVFLENFAEKLDVRFESFWKKGAERKAKESSIRRDVPGILGMGAGHVAIRCT